MTHSFGAILFDHGPAWFPQANRSSCRRPLPSTLASDCLATVGHAKVYSCLMGRGDYVPTLIPIVSVFPTTGFASGVQAPDAGNEC